jgi:hypothetical protein
MVVDKGKPHQGVTYIIVTNVTKRKEKIERK